MSMRSHLPNPGASGSPSMMSCAAPPTTLSRKTCPTWCPLGLKGMCRACSRARMQWGEVRRASSQIPSLGSFISLGSFSAIRPCRRDRPTTTTRPAEEAKVLQCPHDRAHWSCRPPDPTTPHLAPRPHLHHSWCPNSKKRRCKMRAHATPRETLQGTFSFWCEKLLF